MRAQAVQLGAILVKVGGPADPQCRGGAIGSIAAAPLDERVTQEIPAGRVRQPGRATAGREGQRAAGGSSAARSVKWAWQCVTEADPELVARPSAAAWSRRPRRR